MGSNEKLDFEFIRWILLDGKAKENKKQYAETIRKYRQKIVVLRKL